MAWPAPRTLIQAENVPSRQRHRWWCDPRSIFEPLISTWERHYCRPTREVNSGRKGSAKGMVVTGNDLARHRKLFLAYSAIYPLVWALTRLDALVPASGYMLIASATRRTENRAALPRGAF